jgi:hypothetical protein
MTALVADARSFSTGGEILRVSRQVVATKLATLAFPGMKRPVSELISEAENRLHDTPVAASTDGPRVHRPECGGDVDCFHASNRGLTSSAARTR